MGWIVHEGPGEIYIETAGGEGIGSNFIDAKTEAIRVIKERICSMVDQVAELHKLTEQDALDEWDGNLTIVL